MRAKFIIVCLSLWLHVSALAQNATSGLYVCIDAEGMNNIVTQAQLPSADGQCKPYTKGMFNAHASMQTNARSHSIQTPSSAESHASTASGLGALGKRVPLQTPALLNNPPNNPPVALTTTETATPSNISHDNNHTDSTTVEIIYMCPKANGSHEVIEASHPPHENCLAFSAKQDNSTAASGHKSLVANSDSSSAPASSSAEIATLTTPPQDIYKCFDHMGRASYVGENERYKFKQCTFFSRSFTGAQAELKQKATQTYTLAELAASGVNSGVTSNAALKCTGAGKIEFNGEVKEYHCATRSFNYSPGSSGGSIQLGNQQATIAAHRLDYFDSAGSCGGTVLADNGRVLHLEPTKECPESFKIEARRIAKVVEKSLSINVSGAFKERQRTLAPQINQIAADIGVDPFLIHAVISAESAYKSKAVSHAGAQGLMQLMPATAARFGVTDSFHTGQNIRGGTTYLKWLLKEFNGNLELAIAGYNAGEGNVRKYGYKIPPFIETRAYVPKVLEYYRRYRANPSEVGL